MIVPLFVLASASWSVTTTVDLRDGKTNISAMLLEIDDEQRPIILRLECANGRPDFQFEWYDKSGPDMIVIEVGQADEDRRNVAFRRNLDNRGAYHLAEDIHAFMAQLRTYTKPTFMAHYTSGPRLWTFETSETAKAWHSVSTACR